MQLILDNLVATMIGGTIFLILVSVMISQQERQRESVSYYALEKNSEQFISILERDLHNADSVKTDSLSLARFLNNSAANSFVFHSRFDSTKPARAYCVKYELQKVSGGAYRIQRYDSHPTYYRSSGAPCQSSKLSTSGQSPPLVEWQIVAKNDEDNTVGLSALGTAEAIFVRFAMTSPFGQASTDAAVDTTQWEVTIHPELLTASSVNEIFL